MALGLGNQNSPEKEGVPRILDRHRVKRFDGFHWISGLNAGVLLACRIKLHAKIDDEGGIDLIRSIFEFYRNVDACEGTNGSAAVHEIISAKHDWVLFMACGCSVQSYL